VIRKKSIRSIRPYVGLMPGSAGVYVGVVDPPDTILKRIGFTAPYDDGQTILPRPVGRASLYNAEGMTIRHKDRPMETAYRTVEWHWNEWHGRDTVEQVDFRDVPYQRYPRTYLPAPSVELTLFTSVNGQRLVLTPLVDNWRANEDGLVHAVNLLLDIFGECAFFDDKREQVIKTPLKKLNWKILPPGKHPFSELQRSLTDILARVKEGNRSFVDHRLERINSFGPEFTAIGQGGFSGYVVFGFPKKGLYVLESILYGNATYVLGEDWEELSKLTKAEILNDKLHKDRIIHLRDWFRRIHETLGPAEVSRGQSRK